MENGVRRHEGSMSVLMMAVCVKGGRLGRRSVSQTVSHPSTHTTPP